LRILHISDVHIQVDYDERSWARIGWRRVAAQLELKLARRGRRYQDAPHTLQRLLADAQERGGFDHVVLSGDLTALAVDEEFEGVRKALGDLADQPDKLTVIPGNHDVFTPGSARKKRFEAWFGNLLESDLPELRAEGPWPHVRLLGDDVAIVGLCSARVPPVPGIAAGYVGEAQLAALVRICEHPRVVGRTIHVVVHHAPLRANGRLDSRHHGMADGLSLVEAAILGKVDSILCGHIHNRFRFDVAGGPRIVCGGSSTCLGHEGYWLLDSTRGNVTQVEEVALPSETGVVVPAPGAPPAAPAAAAAPAAKPALLPGAPLAAAS